MNTETERAGSRHDQMHRRYLEFDLKHPEVWRLFVHFSMEKIRQGYRHYSARSIFHRIRWETEVPASYKAGEEFKLNDHYSPFYARRFLAVFPEHEGFFRIREQISKKVPASSLPELTPAHYRYVPDR